MLETADRDRDCRRRVRSKSHCSAMSPRKSSSAAPTTRQPSMPICAPSKAFHSRHEAKSYPPRSSAYTEAIRPGSELCARVLGPIARSHHLRRECGDGSRGSVKSFMRRPRRMRRQALELAPDLAAGHLALATCLPDRNPRLRAGARGIRASPSARARQREVLSASAAFAAYHGTLRMPGLPPLRRAVVLDPLIHAALGASARRCMQLADIGRRQRSFHRSHQSRPQLQAGLRVSRARLLRARRPRERARLM